MALRFALLVALYVLCTWYAEAFIRGPAQVTLFWPAAGIAFAAVIRYGWRWAFFVPVAVLLAHAIFVKVPVAFLPFSVLSNLVGSLVGAHVALGRGYQPMIRVASGFAMLRGAVVMVLVSAVIGTAGLLVAGMVPAEAAAPAMLKWMMGDLLGIVCIVPIMLILTAPPTTHPDVPTARDYAPRVEVAAWAASLLASYAIVFLGGRQDSFYALGMVALPLSLLLWSAFRFSPIWTALGTCLSVFFLTSMTGLGLAGFRPPVQTLDSVLLLGFLILFAMVPMAIAASVNQQRMSARKVLRHAVRDAEAQRVVLEQQVNERTQQLHAANVLLEAANDQLQVASHTDQLTGLRNRRYLAGQIPADLSFYDREQKRTGRDGHTLLFALIDIDHFKRINDSHGHKAGDLVLQQFAQVILKLVRVGDYVVRWGGEEFLLVFRPVIREFVPALGERIRSCVAQNKFDIGDGRNIHVTCSIGLAEYPLFPGSSHGLDWEQMVELADAALYWVKHNGRDGWAVLHPTAATNMHELLATLKLGAAPLIESGQLALVSSMSSEGRPPAASEVVATQRE